MVELMFWVEAIELWIIVKVPELAVPPITKVSDVDILAVALAVMLKAVE
jgi:hypothetical protein